MKKITKIEAVKQTQKPKQRVAAYARVSSDSETLLHSLSAQISYYSNMIQTNPDWIYVGVYADEGITGTSTAKRDDFKRLIADCNLGRIDIVLTKSISRFARNTVDLLETVRHLKSIGVEVRFERERISSLSGDGELMISILASFAQEESRSLSDNIKWAIKKGYEKGKPHVPARALGYKWDGEQYKIVPEEVETVKFIFEQYLAGISLLQLPKLLKQKGMQSIKGNPFCRASLVCIIKNELYIGNLVFQKFYSPKIRQFKRNYGEVKKYRVEDAHEPIISKELYQEVQKARQLRSETAPNKDYKKTCFSGKMKCGKCGYSCSRRNIVHSKKIQREFYKRWTCNKREVQSMQVCDLESIDEDELRQLLAYALDTTKLDEELFQKKVDHVVIFDEKIEVHMLNGEEKICKRK